MSNRKAQSFRGGDNSEDADVDNIDFMENEEDEEDAENGGSAAANGGEDDEIDPLDAFMEGIHEEVKAAPAPKPKEKLERYKDDEDDDHVVSFLKAKKDLGLTLAADALNAGYNSDEEVYAAAKAVDAGMLEYDSDDNPIVVDKRKIEPIQALDHSSIDYEPINKDFYEEVESISGMSEQEALDYRQSLGIRVSGFDVPRPVRTFEDCGFSSQIMSAIKKQAYERPTTIQCQALPIVLSGRDIIGIAKTGSGKTAAFVLPMIVHIMDQPELQRDEGPIGVICAPTRELAHQIFLEAKKFSKAYGLRVSAVYGGMSKHEQFKELKAGCEIVVATPGRLIDMLKIKALTMMRATYLVLDEADRMFDLGFEPQVRSIVGQIRPDRQTLLFSATMPWKVEKLAREILSDPIRVTVGEAGMANEDITQVVNVIPSDAEKLPWLLEKLPGMIDEGDVLVFASKKATVDEIEAQLTRNGFKVAALHGDKDQASRMETLHKFKSGIYHVLVATDVAARGLDIKSLKTVVNYDASKDMDMHVHRIGRTGRAGDKDGVAYTLVTQREARFAGELINSLVAAGQNVPPELMDLAMKDGRFKSKRDGRKGGGKKGRGRGGGSRGVRGVDFGLGIGFNSESSGTSSQAAPSRSSAPPSRKGAINSVRTGVMAQFKNRFVDATPVITPQVTPVEKESAAPETSVIKATPLREPEAETGEAENVQDTLVRKSGEAGVSTSDAGCDEKKAEQEKTGNSKVVKETHENQCLELEAKAQNTRVELEKKLKDAELQVADSTRKLKELEKLCQSKSQKWEEKECTYQSFINKQYGALQDLNATSVSIKHEVLRTQKKYFEDLNYYGLKLKGVADAAKNYHVVLEENRRLYNEVQELKGNIRVYCRIRPFLPGQNSGQTSIEYVGENGELVVANPFKQGKDTHRLFKFNKVFGQAATQEEVFLDTRPLIRSTLDGYNVCIFAYGQTGSGKTYTMSGPNITSKEDWGVNYRALNDLFHLTQIRQNTTVYEVGVQMVEIYNEQVRDILSHGGSNRRLGIWNTALPNGLAVPDASMHSVRSTEDVLELMNIGLMNRTVGATALNERSSRSHCVLSVHVRGVDVETNSVLRGSLHLVDLAGSERVDRSEATGERLKEAQHINKSLSALGDVIFALAHKNPHVPYRNSKLTQVLQSSLGGQAKTLMFVQVNPDGDSYAETVSTLKFAERVSGVELGAAKSNKEGRDVRHLMEQVSNLKDVIAKKDEELQNIQKPKGNNATVPKRGLSNLRLLGPSSPRRNSIGASPKARRGKASGLLGRATSDVDNCSEYSSKHSDSGSQHSSDELKHRKDLHQPSKFASATKEIDFEDDIELIGLADGDSEERLSDISDSCLSMGTETDGSISSAVELTLFPETAKPLEITERPETHLAPGKPEKSAKMVKPETKDRTNIPTKIPKQTLKPPGQTTRPSRLSIATSSSSKALTSAKRPTISSSSSAKPLNRRR